MNRNIALVIAAVLVLGLSVIYAERIHWTPCPPSPEEQCTVHEVHVNPCREAEERRPCFIKRGRNASINFDYTTQFNSTSLSAQAFWATEIDDVPFGGMPTDACKFTVCPASPDQRQTYSIVLPISRNFPPQTFDLKWKMWNERNQTCCFMFQIKLVK